MTKLSFKFVIPCYSFCLILWIDAINKDYIFAYSNYRRNNFWNQYAWISQVYLAKRTDHLVSISSGPWVCYLNYRLNSQQNVTDIINQEKWCSKVVTILFYFPKRLSFKIYENLHWIWFSLISFELVGLTWLKVYKKILLHLLQSSWFQIQYNAVCAKFLELSLCWRM